MNPSKHAIILLRDGMVLLFLLAFSFLLRMPVFTYLVVFSTDESAFLIVGQDLARGHLPYANYWALKPPLGFAFYAAVIALFGNSLVAVRIAGALYIGLAAFVLYLAGKSLHSRTAGLLAALLLIVFSTCLNTGYAVMTEHLALLPLTLIAYWVCRDEAPPAWKIGLVIGVAAMIRTNLGVLLPAGIWLHYYLGRENRNPWHSLVRVGLWAAVPVLLLAGLYAYAGLSGVFFRTNFVLAWDYAQRRLAGIPDGGFFGDSALGWNLLLFAIAAIGIFALYRRGERGALQRKLLALAVCALAALASILLTGGAYGHYTIQALPFFCLPVAYAIVAVSRARQQRYAPALYLCLGWLLCVLASGTEVWKAVRSVASERALPAPPKRYAAWEEITSYLRGKELEGHYIFCPQFPIFNFLTGALLPTSFAHPVSYYSSVLHKMPEGSAYTHDALVRDIFAKEPKYVILFTKLENPLPQMMTYLERDYRIDVDRPEYLIYERQKD